MGGRGSYAAGNNPAYNYKTVGEIEGVKVLAGQGGLHNLPEEAHSSRAYIKLDHNGIFDQYREYDEEHYLVMEIHYHREYSLTGHYNNVLHIHEYQRDNFADRPPRFLTQDEMEKYKKFFKGVSL